MVSGKWTALIKHFSSSIIFRFTKACPSPIHTDIDTPMGGCCHARFCESHWEQFRVNSLAQGHNNRLGWIWTLQSLDNLFYLLTGSRKTQNYPRLTQAEKQRPKLAAIKVHPSANVLDETLKAERFQKSVIFWRNMSKWVIKKTAMAHICHFYFSVKRSDTCCCPLRHYIKRRDDTGLTRSREREII